MYKFSSTFFVACMIALVVSINNDAVGIGGGSWILASFQLLFITMGACFAVTFYTKPNSVEVGYVTFENSPKIAALSRYVGTAAGVVGLLVLSFGTLGQVG